MSLNIKFSVTFEYFAHVARDIICVRVTVRYEKSKLDMKIQKGEFGSVINKFINKVRYKQIY